MLDDILNRKLHFRRKKKTFIGENIIFQDRFSYLPANILENTFAHLQMVYSEPKRNWLNTFVGTGINKP